MFEPMLVSPRKNKPRELSFTSLDPFFSEEVIIHLSTPGRIMFTHPTLDYRGRTFNFYKQGHRWANGFVADFPRGKYDVHEDSDEDHYIIDLTTRIPDEPSGIGEGHPERVERLCIETSD